MNIVNGLHFNNLRGDVYGGLTAAVVALPLAMAMGVASGVGPVAGMYGAIFVGLFAALFGGTPAQVSGPTGPMTVVMAVIFTHYTGMFPDDPAQGAVLAFTVVMMGGLLQIGMGLLKLGHFIELVPHPVVSGFMNGIGVIIILLQLGPMLGLDAVSQPLLAAQNLPDYIATRNDSALFLTLAVLAIVYFVPRFLPALNRFFPSPLLALLIGTLIYVFAMEPGSIPIIGQIPTGFPEFMMPVIDTSLMLDMLASAFTLAGLGAIDSLLTSLVADNVTRSQHKSDRELIGQGIGNTVAGLFGGLPGAGATMRTVVNVKAGGRTPISGALHAIILLLIVLGAGALAEDIPKAVLAGILIKVGTDIIDWDYLKNILSVPKAGALIMFVVFFVTVIIDLLLAVGIGMVMASFLFMQRMTQMQIESVDLVQATKGQLYLSGEETEIIDQSNGAILLFHLSGPRSFSSAKAMSRTHADAAAYRVMLLDLTEVPLVDFTTCRALENIIIDTLSAGREVLLVGARERVISMLEKQQVLKNLQKNECFLKRIDALKYAQQRCRSV